MFERIEDKVKIMSSIKFKNFDDLFDNKYLQTHLNSCDMNGDEKLFSPEILQTFCAYAFTMKDDKEQLIKFEFDEMFISQAYSFSGDHYLFYPILNGNCMGCFDVIFSTKEIALKEKIIDLKNQLKYNGQRLSVINDELNYWENYNLEV